MFFQWRAARAGAEKFHSGMVPHAGRDGRGWSETVALGERARARSPRSPGRRSRPTSPSCSTGTTGGRSTARTIRRSCSTCQRIVLDWYRPLFAANIAVDFAHPAQDLGGYRLVVAPNLHLATTRRSRALTDLRPRRRRLCRRVLQRRRRRERPRPLAAPTADVRAAARARVDEVWPLAAGAEKRGRVSSGDGRRPRASGRSGSSPTAPSRSPPIRQAPLAGLPAVIRTPLGDGVVYYCSAGLDAGRHRRDRRVGLRGRSRQPGRGRAGGRRGVPAHL